MMNQLDITFLKFQTHIKRKEIFGHVLRLGKLQYVLIHFLVHTVVNTYFILWNKSFLQCDTDT